MKLYSWDVCLENITRLCLAGCKIHQQFNCASCGAKQTIEIANTLYEEGQCEECNHITDIRKDGINYLVIASSPEAQLALVDLTTKC